jgi:hypothetical protein
MRKKMERKSKVLYKVFRKGAVNSKENVAPFVGSNTCYYGNMGILRVDNAKGFVTLKVLGKLKPCENGFHAFEDGDQKIWAEPGYGQYRVYKVRLWDPIEAPNQSKWIGSEFEILERVTVKDLRPRRWRD